MQGDDRVVELLNEVLTIELTAVNQYFLSSKMCEDWGILRLAGRFRDLAFDEMRDVEELIERILFLEGLPNMQRLGSVAVGEDPIEQLRLGHEAEQTARDTLARGVELAVEAGDHGTREMLAEMLEEEEEHLDWYEVTLDAIDRVGEQAWLQEQLYE